MNKEDQERLLHLKARVWRKVAQKLLEGDKDPYQLESYEIEGHKGRYDKAIRLLSDVLEYSHKMKDTGYYSRERSVYNVKRFEESKELVTYPEFKKTWQEYHYEVFSGRYAEQTQFEVLGYKCIDSSMSNTDALYIYWHQDEFDTITYSDNIRYYPKVLKETRIKAMLRALVEHHFQKDFPRKLERYLGLPVEALKDEGEFRIEPRNFSAYASSFTQLMYSGTAGFLEEYTHYRKYFEGLIHHLNTINRMVEEKSGHAAIVEEMRRDSVQQLLLNSPLCINYEPDADAPRYTEDDSIKYTSTYILKHTDYFEYDILYADDTSIEHIEGDIVTDKDNETYKFTPTEDTIKVVTNLEQERRLCSAQMISGILPVTSKTVPTI